MNTKKHFWHDLKGIEHLSKTQQAEALGCSRSTIANLRREYRLHVDVQTNQEEDQ